ncbi:hypothetical protein [uncultured Sutterella sp.]|uniref:hypothetical protein n=1 Tax=uncultured Sutterella sp. TaxID=286133 RepID=UPI00266EDC77|nr:hypothetical protein [uncultured Sutterella sp.]
MASFMTKVLNAFGLHTEAELNEARADGAPEAAPGASLEDAQSPLADTSPCGLIYRQAAIDIPQLSFALQTQVKAQAIEKIRRLLTKEKITAEEFELWKRRILML